MFKHVAVPTCRIEYLVATAKSIELTWNLAVAAKLPMCVLSPAPCSGGSATKYNQNLWQQYRIWL